jgi:hypothetical protein
MPDDLPEYTELWHRAMTIQAYLEILQTQDIDKAIADVCGPGTEDDAIQKHESEVK